MTENNASRVRIYIILSIVILLAFAIRLYPIASNLPYTFWQDENNYIETALRFGSGNFNMVTFAHGGFYQLVLFAAFGIYYSLLFVLGLVRSSQDFLVRYLSDPTPVYLIARSIIVLAGTGIVYLSFRIGEAMFNRRVGLASSVFCAFSIMMVQVSSLALADTLSVFILLSSFLFLLKSVRKDPDDNLYYVASMLLGLAVACKYYTVFGIAFIYTGAFLKSKDEDGAFCLYPFLKRLFFSTSLAVFTFAASVPSFISDPAFFYNDTVVRIGGEYIARNPNRMKWLYHFTHHLRNGLGLPLELTALAGIFYAFYKRTREFMLLLVFPVFYYLLLMNSTGFSYHLLPAIPFILIIAAAFLDMVTRKLSAGRSIFVFLLLAVSIVIPTLLCSIKFVSVLRSPDTRILSRDWIEENIPSGMSILEEGYVNRVACHAPPLTAGIDALKRDLSGIQLSGGSGFLTKKRIEYFNTISGNSKAYNIFKVDSIDSRDISGVKAVYVILTGDNDKRQGEELKYYIEDGYFEKRGAAKTCLSKDYILSKRFVPSGEYTPYFPLLMNEDYAVIRKMPLSALRGYIAGPRIDVYRKRTHGE